LNLLSDAGASDGLLQDLLPMARSVGIQRLFGFAQPIEDIMAFKAWPPV